MKDPILHAERKVRYWQRKLEELKKEEKGKRDISPTPPIENKGKKEEKKNKKTRAREFSIPSESEVAEYVSEIHPGETIDLVGFFAYNRIKLWNKVYRNNIPWRDVVTLWIRKNGFVEKPKTLDAAQCAEYADDLKRIKAKYGR